MPDVDIQQLPTTTRKTPFIHPGYRMSGGTKWFTGWVLWHTNPCKLFSAKISLYKYVLVCWLGFLWHINPCRLFNAKPSLYIYI